MVRGHWCRGVVSSLPDAALNALHNIHRPSKKKGNKKNKRLQPGPLALASQCACCFRMISSGVIFDYVPCEFYHGFIWRWITFAYPMSSVVNYLFLYAK